MLNDGYRCTLRRFQLDSREEVNYACVVEEAAHRLGLPPSVVGRIADQHSKRFQSVQEVVVFFKTTTGYGSSL
jgi:hypothetical protein